jgi:hypothetical protein
VTAQIGDKAPAGVTIYDFPQQVAEKVPAVQAHKYFVDSGGEVVIVDPKDNKVADIVKAEVVR